MFMYVALIHPPVMLPQLVVFIRPGGVTFIDCFAQGGDVAFGSPTTLLNRRGGHVGVAC